MKFGLAGVAFVLDQAGRVSGDARHRSAAVKGLGIIRAAAHDAGAGAEWSETTDIISGTPMAATCST